MTEFADILIAIHGIGKQSRNTTIRDVATRLAHSSAAVLGEGELPPVAPQPLGWFHSDVRGAVKVAPLDRFATESHPLARTGFTEVFWADIPQQVVQEGRTMEEAKAWARTVIARARAVYKRAQTRDATAGGLPAKALHLREYVDPDFSLAAEVMEEMIDTVHVLENLTFLAEKAGIMHFDLDEVLDEYLGDVQVVTEFTLFRRDIIGRFHSAMEQIHRKYPAANLHIIAHSEGTVVSFLGLLHALTGERVVPAEQGEGARIDSVPGGGVPEWLTKVNGYLTLGSPIDKHLLLWPSLFENFDFTAACKVFGEGRKIKWRNYYDYGDPVGFELDTAREFLSQHEECTPFEFDQQHDIGFARYMLPGKAHTDYWDDPAVFEHYISDVIKGEGEGAVKPRTIHRVYLLSPAIPYILSAGLLFIGTLLLYRAATAYLHPNLDPLQRYIRFNVLGLSEDHSAANATILRNSLAIAGFIAGVTLFARLPRLTAGLRWFCFGFVAFAVGCVCYFGVESGSRQDIGRVFRHFGDRADTWGIFVLGLAVVFVALWGTKKPSHEFGRPGAGDVARKKRWFFKGMRPLLSAGALAVTLLIVGQTFQRAALEPQEREKLQPHTVQLLNKAHLNREEVHKLIYNGEALNPDEKRVQDLTTMVTPHAPLWPLLFAAAVFLYLWWLAALVFDLAFVWHRYIRHGVGERRLRQWTETASGRIPGEDVAPVAAAT
ncbi:MAG: hypothetical protein M3Y80_12260 [Verrucomicrobiota bacterium]|nr:hypothetical protein [Verrucomicrobiota bacterium]